MVLGSRSNSLARAAAEKMLNFAGCNSDRSSHIATDDSLRARDSTTKVFARMAFYSLGGQSNVNRPPEDFVRELTALADGQPK